jgi:hypothetical protein
VDEGCPSTGRGDPSLDGLGDERRAVVRPDKGWWAAQDEQVRQPIDHVD